MLHPLQVEERAPSPGAGNPFQPPPYVAPQAQQQPPPQFGPPQGLGGQQPVPPPQGQLPLPFLSPQAGAGVPNVNVVPPPAMADVLQLMQQRFRCLHHVRCTAELKFVAAAANANAESSFQVLDVLIHGPDQGGQSSGIVRFERNFLCQGCRGV